VLFATSWRPSGRLAVGVVGAIAAGVAVASALPCAAAFAANSTTTAAQAASAQQKADALGVLADKAVEAYDEAQTKLTTATAQAKAEQAAVAKAEQQVDAAKAGVQALAAAEYETGSASSSISFLLSDDPGLILAKAATLAQVNRAQTASLTTIVNADRDVEAAQERAEQALAAQKAAATQVAATKAGVDKALAAQQKVLDSLKSQLAAQQAAAQRAAQVQQQAASRNLARTILAPHKNTTTDGGTTAGSPPAARGNVAAVLAYAYAQLGKPYRWGGAGPSSFDCSGLAMRAWAAGGVSLSHSTVSQQHQGKRVSLSALQPGDLVFWGSPAYHVGIYVGGGRVLDAPHTGTVVQIQAIWGHPSSAVRP
jgi:peptidoglycan DL-endopeptidase CwlO